MLLPASYKSGHAHAGIEQLEHWPGRNAGQLHRDNERLGGDYFVVGMGWRHQRDMFSLHLLLHHLCVVEAEHVMPVVDEHVEMPQKVTTENSANLRIGCVEIPKILNDNQRVCCGVRTNFKRVEVRKRRTCVETDTDQPGRAFNLQVKVGCQGGIDNGDLGASIH